MFTEASQATLTHRFSVIHSNPQYVPIHRTHELQTDDEIPFFLMTVDKL